MFEGTSVLLDATLEAMAMAECSSDIAEYSWSNTPARFLNAVFHVFSGRWFFCIDSVFDITPQEEIQES